MTDYLDNYFFTSNATDYGCPNTGYQCPPPSACASDPHTGETYCCDWDNNVCWRGSSPCASDGSTFDCLSNGSAWCCLNKTEVCTQTHGQTNFCWSDAQSILFNNISSLVLNETYSSLSSASPSASSWAFNPASLIAQTQITPTATTTSLTSTPTAHSSASLSGGAIAGVVIGGIALIALLATGLFFLLKRYRKRNEVRVQGAAATFDVLQKTEPPSQLQYLGPTPSELQGHTANFPPSELPAHGSIAPERSA